MKCEHGRVVSNQHCKHNHKQSGPWTTCYLVISRKLRRVERSSRRLICLWHWLQKKSSASSLRKLWKRSGRGADALERGEQEGKGGGEGGVVSDRTKGAVGTEVQAWVWIISVKNRLLSVRAGAGRYYAKVEGIYWGGGQTNTKIKCGDIFSLTSRLPAAISNLDIPAARRNDYLFR